MLSAELRASENLTQSHTSHNTFKLALRTRHTLWNAHAAMTESGSEGHLFTGTLCTYYFIFFPQGFRCTCWIGWNVLFSDICFNILLLTLKLANSISDSKKRKTSKTKLFCENNYISMYLCSGKSFLKLFIIYLI